MVRSLDWRVGKDRSVLSVTGKSLMRKKGEFEEINYESFIFEIVSWLKLLKLILKGKGAHLLLYFHYTMAISNFFLF